MLDIKYIRENLDRVKDACKNKQVKCDVDHLLEVDEKRRKLIQEVESLKSEKNKLGKDDREKAKEFKNKIKELEPELNEFQKEFNELIYKIPNITDPEMPIGKNEDENVEIKKWGEIPKFDFKIKSHMELGVDLDIIDTKKAAEVSGSRFFYLKNEAVLLQFAIVQFVLRTLTDKKIIEKIVKELDLDISTKAFSAMLPPVMIRDSVQKSIHRVFGDQTYCFKDEELNLVASAEHTMAPYHMNEVINRKELPLRYIGYSTAFRREAGTYGKDMSGILRTHQFDKLEMESFTDVETGEDEQKLIVGIQEYLVQQLEIPYRLVHVCTGDTGGPDYNQFDIECWIPSQNKYRETHTSDYMTDYQTRGIKSFYKDKDGTKKLLHTNDATAFAIGRILIAIIENYQQKDGSVEIPEVLKEYIGGIKKIG